MNSEIVVPVALAGMVLSIIGLIVFAGHLTDRKIIQLVELGSSPIEAKCAVSTCGTASILALERSKDKRSGE